MFLGYNNWNGSAKKILHYLLLFLTVILALKIACYFMPFLIALVIANLIEPFIKKISEKTEINIGLIGFAILLTLSLYVAYNDILRIL